jgi:hypothetical protein
LEKKHLFDWLADWAREARNSRERRDRFGIMVVIIVSLLAGPVILILELIAPDRNPYPEAVPWAIVGLTVSLGVVLWRKWFE